MSLGIEVSFLLLHFCIFYYTCGQWIRAYLYVKLTAILLCLLYILYLVFDSHRTIQTIKYGVCLHTFQALLSDIHGFF